MRPQRGPRLAAFVHRAVQRLLRRGCAALLARGCVLCGGRSGNRHFCTGCRRTLPRIPIACSRCGQPLARPLPAGLDCADCILRPPPFRTVRAALLYTFPVDAALKMLKFDGRLVYASAFAELMQGELAQLRHADALLPVPLHRWRHAARGFNQALELARPLARRSGLPLFTITRRVRRTRPQTGLSAAERRRNLRGAFVLTRPLPCRHPLIVDDVMTTGETCSQLARALLAAGAEDVSVLTAARAGTLRLQERVIPANGKR
jgi:ComF family protein